MDHTHHSPVHPSKVEGVDKHAGMVTLIALAITAAYLYSVFVTFSGEGMTLLHAHCPEQCLQEY